MSGAHGDPLPLPEPSPLHPYNFSAIPRAARGRVMVGRQQERDYGRIAKHLNSLAGATYRGIGPPGPTFGLSSSESEPQRAARTSLQHRIRLYGPDVSSGGDLANWTALLKTPNLYDKAPCAVAPFEASKLKILHQTFLPRDIIHCAPAQVAASFRDPDKFIRRTQCEIEALHDGRPAIRPYWDVQLRTDRQQRIQFFKRLAGRGLVGFRRSIRSRVAPFFVAKKNDQIRMVLDAREVNVLHRPPPHTAISTPGAIASLDFSEAILCDGADEGVVGGSVDLSDSFYQWCCDAMAEDFGFDTPETADTFDVTSIWSADGPEPVAPDDLLYPVFRGLSMGWSWALWALHTIVVAVIEPSLPLGVGSMVLDKATPPVPRRGTPVVCVYVDNVSVLGVHLASVRALWQLICEVLEGSGFHLHEYVSPHGAVELVGLVFVSKSFWIQHKPARLCKFRKASAALARLPFVFA